MKVYVVIVTNETPIGAYPYCEVFSSRKKAEEYVKKECSCEIVDIHEKEVIENGKEEN